jgi:lipopolysaccharide/colanic/teichoic acid biosynthesis glycosyltransferase
MHHPHGLEPRHSTLSWAPPEENTQGQHRTSLACLYPAMAKRVFDVALTVIMLLCLLPFLIVIAIAIKLDSPGPVFYRVRRVGYLGQPLMMLKFRKMRDDAAGGPLTIPRDPRLTRVGRILTLSRLDELPQLWDVLCGRMSLVGPRPEDPGFVALHATEYRKILAVRPGITGLSQIAYRDESEIVGPFSPVEFYLEKVLPQKLTLDALYADTCSPRLDASILFWTCMTAVLRHPVSVHRASGAMRIRRRPATLDQGSEVVADPTTSRLERAVLERELGRVRR